MLKFLRSLLLGLMPQWTRTGQNVDTKGPNKNVTFLSGQNYCVNLAVMPLNKFSLLLFSNLQLFSNKTSVTIISVKDRIRGAQT